MTTSTTVTTPTTSTMTATTTTTTTAAGTTVPTTSTTAIAATTTTLPDRPCDNEPVGPTFRSLSCRLVALIAQTRAGSVGDLQRKLLVPLVEGKERKELAVRLCADGQTKQPKVRLKQLARQLTEYSQRLRGRVARERVPEEIREPLAQTADALRADAGTLRRVLRCPRDAVQS